MKKLKIILTLISLLFLLSCSGSKYMWKPSKGPLLTKWAEEIDQEMPLPEYPRPQIRRDEWLNLNGLWEYSILPVNEDKPEKFMGNILVPYPVESALSGVMEKVGKENHLWYRRKFSIPYGWEDKNILINFGAVDWESTIWINGIKIGNHRGGYDAFSYDITDQLNPSGDQEIVVKVWDPVDEGKQPRGKQVNNPRGIWYTPVTGIWQTVWLEPVYKDYIKDIKLTPNVDQERLIVSADVIGNGNELQMNVVIKDDGKIILEKIIETNSEEKLPVKQPKLWSPESPFLYDIEFSLLKDGEIVDNVESYFGMRKIALEKEEGISKIYLNNEFYFQFGPLDQGWWPDGLYTAPVDEALKYDIEVTKKLGFNMARKHVKVEPARWYYWCDKLGLLVWQDMPSGDEYIDPNEPDLIRSEESAKQFEIEWKEIINQFYNTPSIVTWVPFNEGWGQYDTERIVKFTKDLDPSRLVINTSGWADRGVGDINDIHAYPGPNMPEPEENRAVVLGEFGGLGLPLVGHTWQSSDNWGYRSYENKKELTAAYTDLIRKLQEYIGRGLSAAVYTQTTDVEVEVNGLMTYDRSITKMDPKTLLRINNGFLPPIFSAESDIFLKKMEVKLSNEVQKGKIYFTLDGSVPNSQSILYQSPIAIDKTTTIKAITYWEDGEYSEIAQKSFTKVNLVKSIEQQIIPGIKYGYYSEGINNFEKLPDFEKLEPKSEGLSDQINIKKAESDNYFAMKFEGYIDIPTSGVYTFYTDSDDGSKLFIHGDMVVDNDYTHGMTEKSGQIALEKGLHPIKVIFFQGEGGKGLIVRYKGPGIEKQIISKKILFH